MIPAGGVAAGVEAAAVVAALLEPRQFGDARSGPALGAALRADRGGFSEAGEQSDRPLPSAWQELTESSPPRHRFIESMRWLN